MSGESRRRAALAAGGLSVLAVLTAAAVVGFTAVRGQRAGGGGHPMGDLNLDGAADVASSFADKIETADAGQSKRDDSRSAGQDVGQPRRWGAGVQVSPYSSANLFSGNLFTVLPLTRWEPVGPAVEFVLYHNSQSDSPAPGGRAVSLGLGWTTSYSDWIDGDGGDGAVVLVRADGQTDDFTSEDGSEYAPPAGVYDRLVWSSSTWTLTRPDQSKMLFDSAGRLTEIVDSSGNRSTIERDQDHDYRITAVTSAAHNPNDPNFYNQLEFTYVSNPNDPDYGNLYSIMEPYRSGEYEKAHQWTFVYTEYDGQRRLCTVNYPNDANDPSIPDALEVPPSSMGVWYDPNSAGISQMSARDGRSWYYSYTDGRVTLVEDPWFQITPGQWVQYTQSFEYLLSPTPGPAPGGGEGQNSPLGNEALDDVTYYETIYTDRREYAWTMWFDAAGNALATQDPLEHVRRWVYSAQHERTAFTNELELTWTATYGAVGNVLAISSPLTGNAGQTWTYTWAQPDPNERPNFWRLTQLDDPLDHWVQYGYTCSFDPTLVTAITEMAPGSGGSTSSTTIEYYDGNTPTARGKVRLVVDANGVTHYFEYDDFGYFKRSLEGLDTERLSMYNPAGVGPNKNSPTGDTDTADDGNGHCGRVRRNANGQPVVHACCGAQGNRALCEDPCASNSDGRSSNHLLGWSPQDTFFNQVLGGCAGGCCEGDNYFDIEGRPLMLSGVFRVPCAPTNACRHRQREFTYDGLGRVTEMRLKTNEQSHPDDVNDPNHDLLRTFSFTQDPDGRPLTVDGPDPNAGTDHYTYDELGRVQFVTHGALGAYYTYDEAGRLFLTQYTDNGSNPIGAQIVRSYDNADRLINIGHWDSYYNVLLWIEYTWNPDNTVATRTEVDYTQSPEVTAVTTFSYDNRKRLTGETRVVDSTTEYDLEYGYDGLGNRTQKIDQLAERLTAYVYDTDWDGDDWRAGMAWQPTWTVDEDMRTRNNRLLEYREFDGLDPNTAPLLRTVRYEYIQQTGHVAHMTVKDHWNGQGAEPDAYKKYYDLWFVYAANGTLWKAIWQNWTDDPNDPNHAGWHYASTPDAYTDCWEFRYDTGRARYWVEKYITAWLDPDEWTACGPTLTDYLGEQPYADYYRYAADPNGQAWALEAVRYLAGLGVHGQEPVLDGNAPAVNYQGDLIRSTLLLTSAADGTAASDMIAYTAFGELVGDPNSMTTRYRYAGGWGYESGLISLQGANTELPPITLQHVGERWYQPGVGRFLERDREGIDSATNVYSYCEDEPVASVDASGLHRWIVSDGFHEAVIVGSRRCGYTRYDFGPEGGAGLGGLVPGFSQPGCVTSSSGGCVSCLLSGGEKLTRFRPTTDKADKLVKVRINSNKKQPYNVWDWNCRHFARDVFRD